MKVEILKAEEIEDRAFPMRDMQPDSFAIIVSGHAMYQGCVVHRRNSSSEDNGKPGWCVLGKNNGFSFEMGKDIKVRNLFDDERIVISK